MGQALQPGEPGAPAKKPRVQLLHAVAEDADVVPAGQGVQPADALALKKPAAQPLQVTTPPATDARPAVQFRQTLGME